MQKAVSTRAGRWMRGVYGFREQFKVPLTRPMGEPTAHAPGADPDRVFIFGNGLAVGWGVSIHDLALTGHLARALSSATGRGSNVRTYADPHLGIATATSALSGLQLGSWDAVIVIIGASDAFQLMSARQWQEHVCAFLDAIHVQAGLTPVLMVGISPPSSIPFFHTRRGGVIDRWAEHLNTMTHALCDPYDNITYVPPPSTPEIKPGRGRYRRYRGPEEYGQLATHLVSLLPALLRKQLPGSRQKESSLEQPQDGLHRVDVLRALRILDTAPEERFDHLIQMARTVFGTEGAAFTLVDEHRQWHKAAIGVKLQEGSLENSFCNTTIRTVHPLVVTDAWHDERPLPHTDVRFYVGHPIEAPDGTRIGAICVFDSTPRTATASQLSFLSELAHTLQHELTQQPHPQTRQQANASQR